MPHHLEDLARLPRTELEHILRYGETPDFGALEGWVFRGANVLLPQRLLVPKFAKGFFTEARDGKRVTMGYNLEAEKSPFSEPWKILPDPSQARPYGFFEVTRLPIGDRKGYYPNALFFDYALGGSAGSLPFHLMMVNLFGSRLRDFLVQVEPNNRDLYLGKAYYSVGAWLDQGFFVLERLQRAPDKPPR
jgi:hypothetical protein